MESPEIVALRVLSQRYRLLALPADRPPLGDDAAMPAVDLYFGKKRYELYVYDEYSDLSERNPLLNLCLVLMALEDYQEESDYLTWCRSYGLPPANETIRQWHMQLRSLYPELEQRLDNEVDPFISRFDWELNAGAAQELRRMSEDE